MIRILKYMSNKCINSIDSSGTAQRAGSTGTEPPPWGEVQCLLEELRDARRLRATSLIVTVFGDAVRPHAAHVWMGTLIRLLEPLGLQERLVRTAMLRLRRERWFRFDRIGRRSRYQLTPSGEARFEEADRRIYLASHPRWNGRWLVVFLGMPGSGAREREQARRELRWLGFGSASPQVMLHALPGTGDLLAALRELGLTDRAAVLTARHAELPETREAPSAARLVEACWDLALIAADYEDFLRKFGRLGEERASLQPEQAFVLRTLLVHEYRRIALRDPGLPDELLPPDWAGRRARELCAQLYRRLDRLVCDYLEAVLMKEEGGFTPPSSNYLSRFGGLRRPA